MKGKRVSLANRYKRFFLSERTSLVAAVMATEKILNHVAEAEMPAPGAAE